MNIEVVSCKEDIVAVHEPKVYLVFAKYDDFGFCTTFNVYFSKREENYEMGLVKIGCKNLTSKVLPGVSKGGFRSYSIKKLISDGPLLALTNDYYSLGCNYDYYINLMKYLGKEQTELVLIQLNDLVKNYDRFILLYNDKEECLTSSLMRDLRVSDVKQFGRILHEKDHLTNYNMEFKLKSERLNISVKPKSLPSSNIHILIGRNGVGKTWMLCQMISKLLSEMGEDLIENRKSEGTINNSFELAYDGEIAGVIGVSFSAFDDALFEFDFSNVKSIEDEFLQHKYKKIYQYIGLIESKDENGSMKIKDIKTLCTEFMQALSKIRRDTYKILLVNNMCEYLRADDMFEDNGFIQKLKLYLTNRDVKEELEKDFNRLSSGHKTIIISLTLLCNNITESTVVFIDEPETHLHPPLLATYVRALSYILTFRNALAIIATHSPIILQEISSDCVTKIEREGEIMHFSRPNVETFATNVDVITRDIFGHEVNKTGFYKTIKDELAESFESTVEKFGYRIGTLGQLQIQRLIEKRNVQNEKN